MNIQENKLTDSNPFGLVFKAKYNRCIAKDKHPSNNRPSSPCFSKTNINPCIVLQWRRFVRFEYNCDGSEGILYGGHGEQIDEYKFSLSTNFENL